MLVRIAAYTTAIEAHLARGRLEVEGIPAFVAHENHVWADWPISGALKGAKVYIHENHAARGTEIIAAHNRGEYALPDDEPVSCPRCGSTKTSRRRMSWKAALLIGILFSIPLYFRWATQKCRACGNEWDLPETRAYSFAAIGVVGTISAVLVLLFFSAAACDDRPGNSWSEFFLCPFR